ncbi:MAG: type II toxin-antitoxin system RelE/ParE family toxin [Enterobacteriaceae bacterium]
MLFLTRDTEADMDDLYDFIAEHDSIEQADYVLDQLLSTTDTLVNLPEKGDIPKELQALGIREYRQTFFKPYRIIYRIIGRQVVIFVIVDSRRDKLTLLTRRLLGNLL